MRGVAGGRGRECDRRVRAHERIWPQHACEARAAAWPHLVARSRMEVGLRTSARSGITRMSAHASVASCITLRRADLQTVAKRGLGQLAEEGKIMEQ